jgi:DNA-binding transcriptional ArsR family regulator
MQRQLGPVSSRCYEQESEMCKAFAHPTRLRVLGLLRDRERTISELRQALNISGPNLSQHLRILKVVGVLSTVRRERRVYCSCAFPEVTDLCRLLPKLARAQVHQRQRWAV